MRIERIYISGHSRDLRFTRCAVASIRQFYPDIPISLIKDESNGPYDTGDLERVFGVSLFDTPVKKFGWGMAKLEPLFLPKRERFLVLDSDTVFVGRVLDRLEEYDEDFIVELCNHDAGDIRAHYFDPAVLSVEYPDFHYPGWVFNSGQFVAVTGRLRREDFAPFVTFEEPRVVLRPDLFRCGDQGVLNFVLFRKQHRGEVTIRREKFMKWPSAIEPGAVRKVDLDSGRLRYLLHWAGHKRPLLVANPLGEVLQYFEFAYYRKLHGR
jgi:hypothetical protein